MRDAIPPSPAANTDSAAAAPSSSRHAAAGQALAVRGPSSSAHSNLITTMTTRRFLLLSALATLLLMPLAFAFGAAAATLDAPAAAAFDPRLIIVPAVPMVISILKLLIPRLPRVSLPWLAILLGAAAEFAVSGVVGTNSVWGATLGAAGVGLREVVDQMKKYIANIGV